VQDSMSAAAIPGLAAADMLSCTLALSGVLMALYRRWQTGQGDYVDVAMMDSLIACMPNNFGPPMAEKRPPVPKHERSWGGNAMFGLYETKDGGWIALGGVELHFAETLLNALGRPDLLDCCKLPPGPGQDPARNFFRQTFKTRTKAEWVKWFEPLMEKLAFAPVKNLREALDDPQTRAREMVLVDERGWEHLGIPVKFAREPGRVRFELPAHGQHSAEIIRGLGYGEAELRALKERGIW